MAFHKIQMHGKIEFVQGEVYRGLLIHRSKSWKRGNTYAISHADSGLLIVQGTYDKAQARALAQRLADVTDWTVPQERLDPNLPALVADMMERWRQEVADAALRDQTAGSAQVSLPAVPEGHAAPAGAGAQAGAAGVAAECPIVQTPTPVVSTVLDITRECEEPTAHGHLWSQALTRAFERRHPVLAGLLQGQCGSVFEHPAVQAAIQAVGGEVVDVRPRPEASAPEPVAAVPDF